jgi:hypothetical protein
MSWQPIETAPRDTLILLGTESDKTVDAHMFFINLWLVLQGWLLECDRNDIIFPSHWAPIDSPIAGAA